MPALKMPVFCTIFVSIALVTEAVSTSEMSVNFYQTVRRNNPKDSHLHTRLRANLKSHLPALGET
jgi:hypothetical protein